MKHELKDILPKQIFSVISPETSPSTGSTTSKNSSPTSKTSTPSSVTTSKTSSMISQQKLSSSLGKSNQAAEKAPSRPKTRVQLATDLPSASTFKDKTNLSEKEEIFETRVSDSEVSQLIDTEKSTRGKKKNRKSNERKITVKVGSPSISLSNRYEKLENSKDDISSVYMGPLGQPIYPIYHNFSFLNQHQDHFSKHLKNLKHRYIIRLLHMI